MGDEVDPGGDGMVEQLIAMGFEEEKASRMLQRANNDCTMAIAMLLDDGTPSHAAQCGWRWTR